MIQLFFDGFLITPVFDARRGSIAAVARRLRDSAFAAYDAARFGSLECVTTEYIIITPIYHAGALMMP